MCNGQREKIPLWSNFDQHNHIIGCKFQKNLFNLWFYIDCIKILWITCVKPPEQGQIIRWGQFQATNEAFTTLVICCKFQKNCSELWLYIGFLWFHTCAGDSNRVNFKHHRKLLSLWSSAVSFRRFYIDFFMILYMYIAAEQGQITSDDTISKLI